MAGKTVGEVMGLNVGRNIWRRLIHMDKNYQNIGSKKTKGRGCKNNRPRDGKIS